MKQKCGRTKTNELEDVLEDGRENVPNEKKEGAKRELATNEIGT
jgi:hypothetical protein